MGKAIERIDLFDAMLFRDAEGRGERERTVVFDEERLAIVRDRLGDVLFSTITRETIEGFQAKRKAGWRGQPHREHGRGCAAQGPQALRPLAPAAGSRADVERDRGRANRPGAYARET